MIRSDAPVSAFGSLEFNTFNEHPGIAGPPPWGAVDPEFDAAVIAMAARVLPDGYDVADEAPDTFERLCAHMDAGNKMLVWSGASGTTIFGAPSTNFAFRAWHDFVHWSQRLPFTLAGETATAEFQAAQLAQAFPHHPKLALWQALVFVDIVGQGVRAAVRGEFPRDQRRFVTGVVACLFDGDWPDAGHTPVVGHA